MSQHVISKQQKIGKFGEDYALNYLQSQGLILVSRNFACLVGEIDLIMKDQDYLVFVEVRVRKHICFANPLETITYAKKRKIIKTAQFYMQKHSYIGDCRIDVVGINTQQEQTKKFLEWIKNAI